jgi:hypothetical protein|tara:strand:+ start:2423 stop:2704 length:282 start_codon:yes stop_codon:yes gene_type:complete
MIHDEATKGVLFLGIIGAIVGVGKLLASPDPLSVRVVIGRAISSGALGMAAGLLIQFFPEIPFAVQMSAAAITASLGTSFIEKVALSYFKVVQ